MKHRKLKFLTCSQSISLLAVLLQVDLLYHPADLREAFYEIPMILQVFPGP